MILRRLSEKLKSVYLAKLVQQVWEGLYIGVSKLITNQLLYQLSYAGSTA
jgi:hypothetical protein